MNTPWMLILVALTMVGGRLAKLYPKLPKGIMPVLSLALGAAVYLGKACLVDGLPLTEALACWQVVLTGAGAIVGHDLLKPALVKALGEQGAKLVLGHLAKPDPKEKPSEPGISARGATSLLWIWTAVCWLGLGVAAAVTPGCGASAQQVQARVADTMAKVVNSAKVELLVTYEKEGDAAIEDAVASYGPIETDEDRAAARTASDVALDKIRADWKPVWDSIKAFAVTHDQWATALEAGGAVDLDAVLTAFCKLVGLSKPWLELPDIPGAVCPEVSP